VEVLMYEDPKDEEKNDNDGARLEELIKELYGPEKEDSE
jgi:hypothetical protein